jgi:hypothetical protein
MGETVGIRQMMWFVMLESAKDRVIRVDTPERQVPPCVRDPVDIPDFHTRFHLNNNAGKLSRLMVATHKYKETMTCMLVEGGPDLILYAEDSG